MDFVNDVREEEQRLDIRARMHLSARILGYNQVMDFVEDVRKEERDELRSPKMHGYPKNRALPWF